jgi:hypothetical protein
VKKLSDGRILQHLPPRECVMLLAANKVQSGARGHWWGWERWEQADELVSLLMQLHMLGYTATIRCRTHRGHQDPGNEFVVVSVDEFQAIRQRITGEGATT